MVSSRLPRVKYEYCIVKYLESQYLLQLDFELAFERTTEMRKNTLLVSSIQS